jgi:hypothetical protein
MRRVRYVTWEQQYAHPSDLQLLPPSLQPRAICRRAQFAARRRRFLLPFLPRGSARPPDATATVGYHVGAETLGHKCCVTQQHREVVAVTQVLEGLCGVFDRQLGDRGLCEDVFVDSLVQGRYDWDGVNAKK